LPPERKQKPKKRKLSEPAAITNQNGDGRERNKKKGRVSESEATPESWTKDKPDFPEFPAGSWEEYVMSIDTVEELPNPVSGVKERYAYLIWKDGRKTQHKLVVANQKCPQKVCQPAHSLLIVNKC
jgi:chromobox protein 1